MTFAIRVRISGGGLMVGDDASTHTSLAIVRDIAWVFDVAIANGIPRAVLLCVIVIVISSYREASRFSCLNRSHRAIVSWCHRRIAASAIVSSCHRVPSCRRAVVHRAIVPLCDRGPSCHCAIADLSCHCAIVRWSIVPWCHGAVVPSCLRRSCHRTIVPSCLVPLCHRFVAA